MLSRELTENKHYKNYEEILRTCAPLHDPHSTQVMIYLMLKEIVGSLDAIMETIASHE